MIRMLIIFFQKNIYPENSKPTITSDFHFQENAGQGGNLSYFIFCLVKCRFEDSLMTRFVSKVIV